MSKVFKKKHTRIPSKAAVQRLMRRESPQMLRHYNAMYDASSPVLPEPIRVSTLARVDMCKRGNMEYWADLHNFRLHSLPNRSLPIEKFLNLFRNYIDNAVLDQLVHDLTNFRLEFYTSADKWLEVYADSTVDSCMTGTDIVSCYAHPANKLALAALYAPGSNQVIARSIVNTDEKWWVRIFGDSTLLAEKLMAQGYGRLQSPPKAFRMYAYSGPTFVPNDLQYPYFDFAFLGASIDNQTYSPSTGLVEVIINPGNH
jgi:hypothetical protein